jgi:hypothetical protein
MLAYCCAVPKGRFVVSKLRYDEIEELPGQDAGGRLGDGFGCSPTDFDQK